MEGGAKVYGVFRVKNHDFTPKNHIFPIAERGAKIVGVFRVKNHDFTPKNLIFFNFRPPPWIRPWYLTTLSTIFQLYRGGHFYW